MLLYTCKTHPTKHIRLRKEQSTDRNLWDGNTLYSFEMMAEVYSEVDAFPPKSPVMDLPSAMVWRKM